MQLLAVGLNHTTAPVSLREQLALAPDQLGQAVQAARSAGLSASIAVPTKRRSSRPATAPRCTPPATCPIRSTPAPISWPITTAELRRTAPAPVHAAAARRRAPRLPRRLRPRFDGAGRAQILGQMKDAVRTADEAGGLGHLSAPAVPAQFSVAKEVRSTTEIGAHSVSMAAAAVRLSQRIFDKISRPERAVHRRRRNDRTVRHPLRGAESEIDHDRQPHAGTRRNAGAPLSAARSAWPTCPSSCTSSTS
jgi:glutamyl-tRNA reductase